MGAWTSLLALSLATVLGCEPGPEAGIEGAARGGRLATAAGPLVPGAAAGGSACDDGDPCTADVPLLGDGAPCVHTPACDDGDPCTVDTCTAGADAVCSHEPVAGCKACDPDKYSAKCPPDYDGCAETVCLPTGGTSGVCQKASVVGLSWSSDGFGGDLYYYCPLGAPNFGTGQIPPPKACTADADCPAGAACAAFPGGAPVCTPTLAVDALTQEALVPAVPTPLPAHSHQTVAACGEPTEPAGPPWTPQGPCLAELGVRQRWETIRAEVASPGGWLTVLKSKQTFPTAAYADGKTSVEHVRLAVTGPGLGQGTTTLLPTRSSDDVLDVAPRADGGQTVVLRYAWHPGIRPLVARTLDASGATVCEQGLVAATPAGSLSCDSLGGACPSGGRLRAVTLGGGQVLVAWVAGGVLHALTFTPCGGVSAHRTLPLLGTLFGLAPAGDGAMLGMVNPKGRVSVLRLDASGVPLWWSSLRTDTGKHHVLATKGERAVVAWAGGCADRAVSAAWFGPTGAVTHEVRVGVPGPVSDVQLVPAGSDLVLAAASVRVLEPATVVARMGGLGHLLWAREVHRAFGTLAAPSADAVVLLDPYMAPPLVAEDAAGNLFARRATVLPGDGVLPAACTTPGQEGSVCGRGISHCAPGLVCQETLGNVCAPPAPVGAACISDADCQAPATCAADFGLLWFTCDLDEMGGAYTSGYPDYCGAATCKNINRCRAPASYGEACGLGGVCQSGLACQKGDPPDSPYFNICYVPGGYHSCWNAPP